MLRLAIDELVQKHGIKLLEIEESFGWSHEIAGACRIPVIVRLHGPWFLNKRSSGLSDAKRERWEEQGITSAQAVSSPSSNILDAVASYYKIALGKVACIPNPIECVPAHDAWSVNSCKTNSILFVGRFDEVKGGDLVIEAFAALAQHNQNLHLTFVGTDYGVRLNDGSRASFDEYAESAMPDHVRARLKFLGPVPHSEISALRKSHFLTVCASRSEIFPYSILEAMAYGCPIVTTDVGGIPEMITSYRNGILCRSGHVSELISAIQELIENKDLAETLGKQAWLDCNKNFNAAVVAEQVSAFYRSVVGGLS
jgi:glycosyltransferase involved in cell wall biosynthesis